MLVVASAVDTQTETQHPDTGEMQMGLFSQTSQRLADRVPRGELDSLVEDVERVIDDLKHITGERITRLRSDLEASVAGARSTLSDASRRAADKAYQAKDAVQGYVTEKPWNAVAIAIAVGAIVAIMLSRRGGSEDQ